MNFESMYKKHPRASSVLFAVIMPFMFVKVVLEEAPWGELGEAYGHIWQTLKTGKPHGL